jgi:hypothetical protein
MAALFPHSKIPAPRARPLECGDKSKRFPLAVSPDRQSLKKGAAGITGSAFF